MRLPLERHGSAHPGASGPHKGMTPANLPWEIYVACAREGSIDAATYQALHTTIDLDGLLDLLELVEVHSSWQHAMRLNVEGS